MVSGPAGEVRPPRSRWMRRGRTTARRVLGVVKRDLAIIRAVEAVVAVVIVFVLYQVVSAGALASIGRSATGWYSQKMDGIFTVSVVDTSIKLPHLDRESLPIASTPGAPAAPAGPETPAATNAPNTLANS